MINKKTGQHNVAKFINWEFGEGNATATIDQTKHWLKGMLSIALLKQDYKYKDEIQLQLYSESAKEVKRASNNGKWNRIEVYIPIDKIDDFIQVLKEVKEDFNNGV